MSEIYTQPITAPCAWTQADIARSGDWQHQLSGREIDDLDRALKGIRNPRGRLIDITRDDFPLPVLAPRLAEVEHDVRVGRGFFLLRGIPVERYTDDEVFLMNWGSGPTSGAQSHRTFMATCWGTCSTMATRTRLRCARAATRPTPGSTSMSTAPT